MAGLWIGGGDRHKGGDVRESSRPTSQDEWVTVDGEDETLASQVQDALKLASKGGNGSGGESDGDALLLKQELGEARDKMAQMEAKWEAKCAALEQRYTQADEEAKTHKALLNSKEEELADLRVLLVQAQSEAEAARLEASHRAPPSSAGPAAGRDADTLAEELEHAREREQLWKIAARSRISYTSFEPGDFALFLPTSNGFFVAFNRGCPFRYLSSESLEAAKAKCGDNLSYVVGPVIEISESEAMEDPDCNPYGLPIGTPYHVCTVSVQ
mmetsp:Transcript_46632/g.116817  ORF Transcript_46632/g.116817 Transcript_46632/m.116817 type:complete len:271 (+) Transcript_46632:180-992(+)|eukprot:CAMPEP_0173455248 /NCGR_PEP_ID=MMETSP1357-20121228/53939_1 /TAXON_ID=77926 /ORGANISM="Hemiselmis rufescens, Strain PCC563" /LENGTH=270 /DNA_ID=CAMNT_0014422359 /DNA_START=87 /DNA_END=899 /DNA_ORIENTATION=-